MRTKTFYVYRHIFNNGAIYIGKGVGDRYKSFNQRNVYWTSTFRKYGLKEASIIIPNLSEDEAFELENLVISEYRNMGLKMCNLNNGGKGGQIGFHHSEESKIRISTKQIGKFVSDETKAKISLATKKQFLEKGHPMKGKHISEEIKRSLSIARLGARNSDETREKKRLGQIGRIHDESSNIKKSEKLRDKTIYSLIHSEYGVVFGDRKYLFEKYGITTNSISALIKKRAKIQQGFKLN